MTRTALPRARAWMATGVAVAIAMAAPASFAGPSDRDGDAAKLVFADLAWGSNAGEVSTRLTRLGFRRTPERDARSGGPSWTGRWKGEAATCVPELRASGGLVAVTLRFDPESRGDAIRLYGALGADLERRHGPELVDLGLRRELDRVHFGLRWRLSRSGELAGARLWTSPDGAAAALQLDGERVVWVRWEAPGWEQDLAPDHALPDRR